MRSSSFHTLLSSLLVLLLLSACQRPSNIEYSTPTAQLTETSDTVSVEMKQVPHLELAESYVGTQELTGQNDGPDIERFLASVGLPAGNPYCAAFISFVLDETPDIKAPTVRSGLASHFITDRSIDAREVLRGTVSIPDGTIVIWRKGNTIYGHAGFVSTQTSTNEFETIEANTSSGVYGNQDDGDGVWRRQRSIQPANYFRITDFTSVVYHS